MLHALKTWEWPGDQATFYVLTLFIFTQTVQAGGGEYGCRLPARPRTPVFREAQKHVRRRLEKKWLAEFIKTSEFKARNGGTLLKDAHRGRRMSTNGQAQSFVVSKILLLLLCERVSLNMP